MDGSGALWNNSGHIAIHSRSLMISIVNVHGWKRVFPIQCWVEC
jgi:hypothetical protein